MNRRNFFKFLGKSTGVGIVAITVGVSELPKKEWESSVTRMSVKTMPLDKTTKAAKQAMDELGIYEFPGLDHLINTGHIDCIATSQKRPASAEIS